MKKQHLGSTIALVLGIICLLGLAGNLAQQNLTSSFLVGPVITLGALAYRSAKKRYLGEVNNTLLRKSLEILSIVIILALVLLQNNVLWQMANNPFSNLFVPLWAIIAYVIIAVRKPKVIIDSNLQS